MGNSNDMGTEMKMIKQEIGRYQAQVDDFRAEIEDMEADVMNWEDEISELEGELRDLEEQAAVAVDVIAVNIYFDELVKGLESYNYAIERDPWIIYERWGMEDVEFCVLMFGSGAVYSGKDFCPISDTLMTLVPRVSALIEEAMERE